MAKQPLTVEEEALAALLQRAGLARPAARCLAALARGGPWTGDDAADATGLSPPDARAGLKSLFEAGVATQEKVARDGPGRPLLRYRLVADKAAAFASVVEARRAWLRSELAALEEVEARLR